MPASIGCHMVRSGSFGGSATITWPIVAPLVFLSGVVLGALISSRLRRRGL